MREADRLRGLPLHRVAPLLGYRRDPRDPTRWRREGSVLSIAGMMFFDHVRGRGGGGAIDLVVHALGATPGEAIRWLRKPAAAAPTAAPPPAPRRPCAPPPASAANWPAVRNWLAGRRCLDPERIDRLARDGLIRADDRANAVFACRSADGTETGAELAGTGEAKRFRGMAPGSRKAEGGFWIPAGAGPPEAVMLVESAVDALSAAEIGLPLPPGTIILSTAGAGAALPAWIRDWKPERVICGFDADEAGDRSADSIARSHGRVARLRPECEKDWNDLPGAGRRTRLRRTMAPDLEAGSLRKL